MIDTQLFYPSKEALNIDPLKQYKGIVYKITNIQNNKSYIGKTNDSFNKRYAAGKWWLKTHNIELKEDYAKFGEAAFIVEIIEKSKYT